MRPRPSERFSNSDLQSTSASAISKASGEVIGPRRKQKSPAEGRESTMTVFLSACRRVSVYPQRYSGNNACVGKFVTTGGKFGSVARRVAASEMSKFKSHEESRCDTNPKKKKWKKKRDFRKHEIQEMSRDKLDGAMNTNAKNETFGGSSSSSSSASFDQLGGSSKRRKNSDIDFSSADSFLEQYQKHMRDLKYGSKKSETSDGNSPVKITYSGNNPIERTEQDKDHLKRMLHGKIWTSITRQDWNTWEQLFGVFKERALHYDEVSYIMLMWGYVLSHRHRSENAYLVLEEMRRSGFIHGAFLRLNETLLNSYFELLELNARPEPYSWQNLVRLSIHSAQRFQKKRVQKMTSYLKNLPPDIVMQLKPEDIHHAYLEEVKKSHLLIGDVGAGFSPISSGNQGNPLLDHPLANPELPSGSVHLPGSTPLPGSITARIPGSDAARAQSGDGLSLLAADMLSTAEIDKCLAAENNQRHQKPRILTNKDGKQVKLTSPNPSAIDDCLTEEGTIQILESLEGYVGTYESTDFQAAGERELLVFGQVDEESQDPYRNPQGKRFQVEYEDGNDEDPYEDEEDVKGGNGCDIQRVNHSTCPANSASNV